MEALRVRLLRYLQTTVPCPQHLPGAFMTRSPRVSSALPLYGGVIGTLVRSYVRFIREIGLHTSLKARQGRRWHQFRCWGDQVMRRALLPDATDEKARKERRILRKRPCARRIGPRCSPYNGDIRDSISPFTSQHLWRVRFRIQ